MRNSKLTKHDRFSICETMIGFNLAPYHIEAISAEASHFYPESGSIQETASTTKDLLFSLIPVFRTHYLQLMKPYKLIIADFDEKGEPVLINMEYPADESIARNGRKVLESAQKSRAKDKITFVIDAIARLQDIFTLYSIHLKLIGKTASTEDKQAIKRGKQALEKLAAIIGLIATGTPAKLVETKSKPTKAILTELAINLAWKDHDEPKQGERNEPNQGERNEPKQGERNEPKQGDHDD